MIVTRGGVIAFCVAAALMSARVVSADEPEWRFALVSDTQGYVTGNNGVGQYVASIAKAIANDTPRVDFVLVSGDLISGGAGHADGQPPIADMFESWKQDMAPVYDAGIPVYPIRGNHEAKTTPFGLPINDTQPFLDAFAEFTYIPGDGPDSAVRLTYSFKHKNSLVIGIDNYIDDPFIPNVPQAWLDERLAGNDKPHVFVFGHAPILEIEGASPIAQGGQFPLAYAFFNSMVDASCKVYLCGHEHFYNRAVMDLKGKKLVQLDVATGGGRLTPWTRAEFSHDWPKCEITAQLACFNSVKFGYLLVKVQNDKTFMTEWRALKDGLVSDACDTLDTCSFDSFKLATAGVESALHVDSAASSGTCVVTVTGTYTDPVKGKTKNAPRQKSKFQQAPDSVDYLWRNKIVLFDKKQWDPTLTAAANLAAHPIPPALCAMTTTVKDGAAASDKITYSPPIVISLVDSANDTVFALPANQSFTVNGAYFGTKAPKAYLEYAKDGKLGDSLKLKVAGPLAFPDAKGRANKSCTDVSSGMSTLLLTTPKAWPKGWDPTGNQRIVIDNGIGRATLELSTQPPVREPEE